jgi:hypothetical protein
MKLPQITVLLCELIACLTLLVFTWLTRTYRSKTEADIRV